MAQPSAPAPDELDMRELSKPQRHPMIFERFAALPPAGSFMLVNSHDPKHLRQEFDRDHPRNYTWDYLESGPTAWRIQITKRSGADLPRVLGNAHAMTSDAHPVDAPGAVWRLAISQRQLNANITYLPPYGRIETHTGPDLDMLMHVLDGTGELTTEADSSALLTGSLVWLPRRSRRSVTAGPTGLRYLTVHPRRSALGIATTSGDDDGELSNRLG